ncbi:disulfide bond formation protein DsbA [Paraburkholderia phytofirmans OLGA172]|uniref:Disulfide bond formation protein DsbA n=1 Tax=Paraburkholderia phytofirmans OLGA172 TaxID=1417228 RepID=A0A160FTX7_9BURK|nr:DsbA family oxidoreductase [Paraburkholderia phytofirmans]ANB76501.1 disulfide bond formation protein DsbA [Paraburkholderia phytofirmans OLGA172]
MKKLDVEVMYDFICPWCWIGGEKLRLAMSETGSETDIKLVFIPYELNPGMPAKGLNRKEYRSAKFGSWARSQAMDSQVAEAGRDVGLDFHYECVERTPNTLAAHRLVWMLQQSYPVSTLVENIFRAYFSVGQDVGDVAVLTELAVTAGFDRAEIDTFLSGSDGTDEVRTIEAGAIDRGVNSVPTVKIGNDIVSGAQSVALFRQLLEKNLKSHSVPL